jgi:L-ascorbate metabolism protein UlaG (beta-lactamase superfamily)
MRIRWYGQSSFLLTGEQSVFIDPFGDMSGAAARGLQWNYPPIEGVEADVLLVTHEHPDHNAVDAIGGAPVTLRSTAGTLESPLGEVVAVASEHDDVAGTTRGPNTIFCFTLDRLRVCHMGDFGQPALRPEQRTAIGQVDVLIVPVGSGPTIGGELAAELVRSLAPRLVVPMHYRTQAINFLEPPDAFLDALGARVERLETSEAVVEDILGDASAPTVALLAPPT